MWYFYRVFILSHYTIITRWWGDRTFSWWDEMGKWRKQHGPEFGHYIRATLAPTLSRATVHLYPRQLVSGEQVGRMYTPQRHWARSICDANMVRDFTVLHRHIRHTSYFFPEFSIWFWTEVDHRKSKKQVGKPWARGVATAPTQVCLSAVLFGKEEHY